MSKLNIGVVTVRSANGETGGAERFYESLVDSFQRIGHAATEIIVEADERDFDHIQRNYLACYDLNLQEFDCVISTKAPTWMVRHPRHVCYLVHTVRVFYDMFTTAFPQPTEELFRQQELVHSLDTGALRAPRCKAIFSIGHEVASRLRQYNSLESEVLHPPLWTDDFYEGVAADYILMPGRLHPWKRVDLVVDAMRYVDAPLQLYIVGTGEAESDLKSRASGDGRIKFLGRIADAELKQSPPSALVIEKQSRSGTVRTDRFAGHTRALSWERDILVQNPVLRHCEIDERSIWEWSARLVAVACCLCFRHRRISSGRCFSSSAAAPTG